MSVLKSRPKATKCSDHCTISFYHTYTAQTVARILRRRTETKIEVVLVEDQFRFRRGKGARDATGMLREISERTLDIDEEFCSCFIDCRKALDRLK